MNKIRTTGKRILKDDIWHDDSGPIAGSPDQWEPPMSDAEIEAAALSDPDNPPLTADQLSNMRRVALSKRIRQKLGLSREQFSQSFRIPLNTLSDWERHHSEPDTAMRAYLQVIEQEPELVQRALASQAA